MYAPLSKVMSKVMSKAIIVAFFLAATQFTFAAYTVQFGAFTKQPSVADYGLPVSHLGEIITAKSAAGLTIYQVGRLSTRSEAVALLGRTKDAGFADAWVKRLVEPMPQMVEIGAAIDREIATSSPREIETPSHRAIKTPSRRAVRTESDQEIGTRFDQLSAEERSRVVSVNGVLHVDVGGTLTPLTEYQRGVASRAD